MAEHEQEELKEVEQQKQLLYSSEESTNIEKWYDDIKPYTFETSFISLSVAEARALKFCYEYFSTFKQYELETNGEQKGIGVHLYYDYETDKKKFGESFDWRLALSSNREHEETKDADEYKTHLKHLDNLSKKLDAVIKQMQCDDGIFVKLSRRSAKDSANESVRMFEILSNELSTKCENDFKQLSNAQVIEAYFYASIKSLCVYTGEQVIEQLSRSYRIWKDINLSLLKQDTFNISVIVRKWNEEINPLWEFRLFLRNQQPTALTQYNPHVYFPDMHALKGEIQRKILSKYCNQIKASLSSELQYFTMDFAVKPSNETLNEEEDIVVIEINPGPPVAGTALFVWENEEDRLILRGDKPFETRINASIDDIQHLYDLEPILPDSVIAYVQWLKENKATSQSAEQESFSLASLCVLL